MRTELLFGSEGMEKLKMQRWHCSESAESAATWQKHFARSGVGNMVLTDNDCVSVSNINRQIIALHSTVGRPKVEVMKERLLDINPEINLELHRSFYLPENPTMTMILHHMIMLSTVLIQLLPRLIWCLKRRKQEHRL